MHDFSPDGPAPQGGGERATLEIDAEPHSQSA
jgi:hypothetical protein